MAMLSTTLYFKICVTQDSTESYFKLERALCMPDPSSWQSLLALVGQVIDKAYSGTFRYLSHGVLDSGSEMYP